MSLTLLLPLALTFGIFSVTLALALPLLGRRQRLRQMALRRLLLLGAQGNEPDRAPGLRLDDPPRRRLSFFYDPGGAAEGGPPVLAWFVMAVLALIAGAMAVAVTGAWWALVSGLLIPPLAWKAWRLHRDGAHQAAVDDTVPEALQMIVRALRIGQPVGFAVQSAGRDLTGPLAAEFLLTADRISYGQSVAGALRDLADRCNNQNLRFLAAAVSIQSATGGNLAEVLERLADIARGRQQMRRKIAAIIAEARWSGRFLSAFPLIATGVVLSLNPSHFSEIQGEGFFVPLLVLVGILLVLNLLYMRWLVRVE